MPEFLCLFLIKQIPLEIHPAKGLEEKITLVNSHDVRNQNNSGYFTRKIRDKFSSLFVFPLYN